MKKDFDWAVFAMLIVSVALNGASLVGLLKQNDQIYKMHHEIIEEKAKKAQKEYVYLYIEKTEETDKAKSEVIGFKNNNPGNIKGKNWLGQTGTDKHGHAIFVSEVYGLRAMARCLTKMEQDGIKTIDTLVRRYATGNQESYIKFLCKFMELEPNEEFSISEKLHKLMKAMIHFECGSNPYPPEYFVLLSWSESL